MTIRFSPEDSVPDKAGFFAYVYRQFQNIAAAINNLANGTREIRYVEPEKKSEGMLVYADGTDWDPGLGEGYYVYRSDGWYKLSDVAAAGSWEDLRFPAIALRIDSSATRYSIDTTDLGVSFAANARHVEEQVNMIAQLPHGWKEGSDLHPHIHWIQTTADLPNWLMQYRVYNSDTAPGAWTYEVANTPAFTWASGSLSQISSFPPIDMTGMTVSCIVDIKFWRDVADGSGEFGGAESSPVAVLLKEFDIHYLIDSFGSTAEYTK